MTEEYIRSAVEELFEKALYVYRLAPLTDDPDVVCVRVYGVSEQNVTTVEDRIFDLSDTLFPSGEKSLLPMVKTLAVTKEFYPELLLTPINVAVLLSDYRRQKEDASDQ